MLEMSEIMFLQIIGRAGRPQYDDSGQAIVLTTKEKQVCVCLLYFEHQFLFVKFDIDAIVNV